MDRSLGDFQLVRWRSEDGGSAWDGPIRFPAWPPSCNGSADPCLQTDQRDRFFLVNVTTSRQGTGPCPVVFRRSVDGGQTWQAPKKVWEGGGDKTVLAVSPNGKRLAIACMASDGKGNSSGVGFFRSDNRGQSWERIPGPVALERGVAYGLAIDDEARIASCWLAHVEAQAKVKTVLCSTPDLGRTWSTLELAQRSLQAQEHPYTAGLSPALVRDGEGALHVVYVVRRADGRGFELHGRRSRDWRTWTDAVPISPDEAETCCFPTLSASGRLLHVAWVQSRKGKYQVWYRGSKDHHTSWSAPQLLSRPTEGSSLVGGDGFEKVAGDYISLADDGLGTAHVVWGVGARGSPPRGEIWHATIIWHPVLP
jgi:hypothetical protein